MAPLASLFYAESALLCRSCVESYFRWQHALSGWDGPMLTAAI